MCTKVLHYHPSHSLLDLPPPGHYPHSWKLHHHSHQQLPVGRSIRSCSILIPMDHSAAFAPVGTSPVLKPSSLGFYNIMLLLPLRSLFNLFLHALFPQTSAFNSGLYYIILSLCAMYLALSVDYVHLNLPINYYKDSECSVY